MIKYIESLTHPPTPKSQQLTYSPQNTL